MALVGGVPAIQVTALTTVPAIVAANNVDRKFVSMVSTLAWAICTSTMTSSTQGYPVPAGVAFSMDYPAITTGAIYGIAPAATAPIVSAFTC